VAVYRIAIFFVGLNGKWIKVEGLNASDDCARNGATGNTHKITSFYYLFNSKSKLIDLSFQYCVPDFSKVFFYLAPSNLIHFFLLFWKTFFANFDAVQWYNKIHG
jgi:hypothetical protein